MCTYFKGIIIPKTLIIPTKNNKNQKYSLTGILYYERFNSEYFNHESAYVKRDNKWYNTDYEENKKRFSSTHSLFARESSFFSALKDNNKEEVVFDTEKHENIIFIGLLFYQKEK